MGMAGGAGGGGLERYLERVETALDPRVEQYRPGAARREIEAEAFGERREAVARQADPGVDDRRVADGDVARAQALLDLGRRGRERNPGQPEPVDDHGGAAAGGRHHGGAAPARGLQAVDQMRRFQQCLQGIDADDPVVAEKGAYRFIGAGQGAGMGYRHLPAGVGAPDLVGDHRLAGGKGAPGAGGRR